MGLNLLRRRKPLAAQWEVDKCHHIRTVPTGYYSSNDEILRVPKRDFTITYSFDISSPTMKNEIRIDALSFTRAQLLKELSRREYDVLLSEGWTIVTLRKGECYRLTVQYRGRAAATLQGGREDTKTNMAPPFLELLREDDKW